jgi:hypothetical protein
MTGDELLAIRTAVVAIGAAILEAGAFRDGTPRTQGDYARVVARARTLLETAWDNMSRPASEFLEHSAPSVVPMLEARRIVTDRVTRKWAAELVDYGRDREGEAVPPDTLFLHVNHERANAGLPLLSFDDFAEHSV